MKLKENMTTKELLIRRATPSDAAKLADLATKNLQGYPFIGIYDENKVREGIEGGEHRLVAEETGNILATAVLGEGPMSEIKRVLVAKEARGKGLAKLLTKYLASSANGQSLHPWADVRGDQVGMQKAALHAGLYPVSLESGKHVVYYHENDLGQPIGAARETMVHMTSLDITIASLIPLLQNISSSGVIGALINNLEGSLSPKKKDLSLTRITLPSAVEAKSKVQENIIQQRLNGIRLTDDVSRLSLGEASLLVIEPDLSGFIEGNNPNEVLTLRDQALQIGLQIVTCYLAVNDPNVMALSQYGMTPAVIRPWINQNNEPVWQVGLRSVNDDYSQCLHTVNLDDKVRASINNNIKEIRENV